MLYIKCYVVWDVGCLLRNVFVINIKGHIKKDINENSHSICKLSILTHCAYNTFVQVDQNNLATEICYIYYTKIMFPVLSFLLCQSTKDITGNKHSLKNDYYPKWEKHVIILI